MTQKFSKKTKQKTRRYDHALPQNRFASPAMTADLAGFGYDIDS